MDGGIFRKMWQFLFGHPKNSPRKSAPRRQYRKFSPDEEWTRRKLKWLRDLERRDPQRYQQILERLVLYDVQTELKSARLRDIRLDRLLDEERGEDDSPLKVIASAAGAALAAFGGLQQAGDGDTLLRPRSVLPAASPPPTPAPAPTPAAPAEAEPIDEPKMATPVAKATNVVQAKADQWMLNQIRQRTAEEFAEWLVGMAKSHDQLRRLQLLLAYIPDDQRTLLWDQWSAQLPETVAWCRANGDYVQIAVEKIRARTGLLPSLEKAQHV